MTLNNERRCQELFAVFNGRFFGGRLPFYRILRTDRYGAGQHGLCRKRLREIHLGTGLRDPRLTVVLLHEMCHAATNGGHGKKWLAEMRRLAHMGAPTQEEAEMLEDSAHPITEGQIAAEFYDIGFETEVPWRVVRSHKGKQYGLTDASGRAESRAAAKTMRRFRAEFRKGRRERELFMKLRASAAHAVTEQTESNAVTDLEKNEPLLAQVDLVAQTFEPLLSDAQAGELLGLHPKTVQRLARVGKLPAVRIGRYWRFRASALNEWIDIHSTCQPLTERTR